MLKEMIPVTKPFLPEKSFFQGHVDGIWDRNWLTNNGPLVNQLEEKIRVYLDTPYFHFVSNGTLALQLAIKILGLKGEVITTPFSYVATTNSILWEGCQPVFADINPKTWNIDPNHVEELVSSKTVAIVATHVFGNPCDVEALDSISKSHNIPIIYDAAHSFGTKFNNCSVAKYGDISTLSFHATKLFHTIEGGGLVCKDERLFAQSDLLRNFGYNGQYNFETAGINAKNSEFHAAMGLSIFPSLEEIINKRKKDYLCYNKYLKGLPISWQEIQSNTEYNYSYCPILLESENVLTHVVETLEKHNIYPRRYFYPSLNQLKYTNHGSSPQSESVSKRMLCLPSYHQLTEQEIEYICALIRKTIDSL